MKFTLKRNDLSKIDQEPNISVSRHEGRRTIDEGTYQYYLRLYRIRETDAA